MSEENFNITSFLTFVLLTIASVLTINNLYLYCKRLPLSNSKLCEEHYLKQKSAQHLGTTKYWKELKDILERQEYKCPYTNEYLTLGKNVALDHIVSKKSGLEKDDNINNYQWLSYQANLIKSSLSHEELINFCIKVAEKYKRTA